MEYDIGGNALVGYSGTVRGTTRCNRFRRGRNDFRSLSVCIVEKAANACSCICHLNDKFMNGLSYFSPNYPVHITPLVSVVLIARRVYDCEKCLDTLMKQSTTFETEVIVVDRSSIDEVNNVSNGFIIIFLK